MFDAYIICGTPRTGSTLLCSLLTGLGTLGAPDSFFMREMDPAWARELGLPEAGTVDYDRAYLEAVRAAGQGDTPVFGLRLMYQNLGDVSALLGRLYPDLPSDLARIEAAFGKVMFLHLTRADKLDQAISWVMAEQSGLWHRAPDGTEIERLAPPQEPSFDFDRIAGALARFEGYDAAWESWYAAQGITPLRVDYDRLSADPAAELGQICRALGVVMPDPGTVRPGVAKLADATSAAWRDRFEAERKAR